MEPYCTSLCRDLAPIGDKKTTWIHIVPMGEFPGPVSIPAGYDVPGWGVAKEDMTVDGITVLSARQIDTMLERFKGELLIDADHLSHDAERDTEAMGWGLNLRRDTNGDGLELETEWTPPAREKISNKIYRKISPEFHGAVRYEDGVFKFYPTSLTGAGLTNRPNLKSLRPVSANRQTNTTNTMQDAKKLLCELIGAPETATEQEIADKVTSFKKEMDETKKLAADAARLAEENKTLQASAINGDMERYADVIEDKDATRELLQTNRAATLKVLAAREAKLKGTQKQGEEFQPVYQQNRATPPNGDKFKTEDGAPDEAASAKFRQVEARAHAIAVAERIPFSLAFDKAKAEAGI